MSKRFFGIISNKSLEQLSQFGLVGVSANFAGYLIYLFLTYVGMTPKLTVTILYGVGATISFIGNKKFTFAHKGDSFGTGLRYILAYFLGYLLNLLILMVMVDRLGYPHQWVQALAILIVAGFLFLACKFYVFREVSADGKPVA